MPFVNEDGTYKKPIKKKFTGFIFAGICLFLVFVACPSLYAFEGDTSVTMEAVLDVPALIDTDYDGIPDEFDLKPNDPDDARADSDEDIYNSDDIAVTDGLTNLEEYRLGTDPLVSNSRINARIIVSATGNLQPLDVILTADVTDNGGYNIVKYEWDFDGNGTYDYSSRDPSVTYKYTAPGPNYDEDLGKFVYYVKLRVINEIGNAGVTSATINVERNEDIFPPTAYAGVVIPPDISTPSMWQFTGDATDDKGIANYQWDLTGNGEYDFTSIRSGSVTHRYKTTNPGSISTHFKVTDIDSYSEIASIPVGLDVSKWHDTTNRNLRPVIEFENDDDDDNNVYVTYRKAGQQVVLKGSAIPLGRQLNPGIDEYGWVRKLEWDFEGDGIYDWVIDENNPEWAETIAKGEKTEAKHRYGAPGIYRATFRATSTTGPTVTTGIDITATDHILVIVEKKEHPPTAVATVNYNDIVGAEEVMTEEGGPIPIPVKVTFISSDSYAHPGHINKYEWDFDGDKRFDWSSEDPDDVTYTYKMPGYCIACLRVTSADKLTHTDYIPVFVNIAASYTDGHASVITRPKENQIIAGNRVTLTCDIFPDDVTADKVIFQYSEDGANWVNIPEEVKEIASYMIRWDTTGLDGDYYIRAIVDGVDPQTPLSSDFLPILVTVGDSFEADIYEDDSDGTYTKIVKLNPDKHNEIVLYNGTRIEIPTGAMSGEETIIIEESAGFSAGVGNAIDVKVKGKETCTFLKDITIIMPYTDSDLAGRNENDLVIMWYNGDDWEPLYDSVVYPDENYVAAKINHFTLFGPGFITWAAAVLGAGGATVGEGAVSYCFIATAAYDSADAGDVMILREFRDRFLLTSPLGRKFVNCYYRYSPSIAEYIETKPALKKITRLALKPIVEFARWKLIESRPQTIRGEDDAE